MSEEERMSEQATVEAEAQALEAKAKAASDAAAESFERCDTDGFVSQWALGLTAQKDRLQAEIVRNGGMAQFAALFTEAGELVPAKVIRTRYGAKWAVFATADDVTAYGSEIIEWVGLGEKALAKKGYRRGWVLARAKADYMGGSGTGLSGATSVYVGTVRLDGGFDPDAEIIDDGTEEES